MTDNQTILLSFPKSGNHFVRFLIEYISGRPTRGCYESLEDPPLCNRLFANPNLLKHVDKNTDPIVMKCHSLREISSFYPNHKSLILIVRHYRDALYRFCRKLECQHLNNYLKLIEYYDRFDGPKLLIYYEDLISETTTVVNELATFLQLKTEKLDYLLKNLDTVVNDSKQCLSGLDSYRNINQGQASLTYQNQVSTDQLNMIKHFLKDQPRSVLKYINRYSS